MAIISQPRTIIKKLLLLCSLTACLINNRSYCDEYAALPPEEIIEQVERQLFANDYPICALNYRNSANEQLIQYEIAPDESTKTTNSNKSSDWTFIVYIAADNDLRNFSIRNIKQMAQVGSNQFVNIFVHVDIRIAGNQKVTRRYLVEKDKIVCLNTNDPTSQRMNSGDPKTLVSCCRYAINNYPARHYALVLWNHGTGPIDPLAGRIINPSELFSFNPATCKLELDRSVGFLELICKQEEQQFRGCCWDDSYGQYLTNQKLETALSEICATCLGGNKLDIVAFDACLMSSIEMASLTKKYAHIFVGSQEVELGTGWNYEEALSLFNHKNPEPHEFALHLVNAYEKTYSSLTNDYTQSAINLDVVDQLEKNIDAVGILLTKCLARQQRSTVKGAIKASINKYLCTCFTEPSYKDLGSFYNNLLKKINQFILIDQTGDNIKRELEESIKDGLDMIQHIVIANKTGKNLSLAQGISIYFPERTIHPSYPPVPFAQNSWTHFLKSYLSL